MAKMREEFDCWSWFRHTESKQRVVNSELNPVLLVPGIGGSILNAVNKKNGRSERIWVRIILASCQFKKKLWAVYNPETGYAQSLDPNIEIEVPDDDYGLYAIDMLDPSWVGVTGAHGALDCRFLLKNYKINGWLKRKTGDSLQGFRWEESRHNFTFNGWITCQELPFAAPRCCPGFINDCLLTGMQFVYGLESYLFISRWTMHQLLKYDGKSIPLPFNLGIFKWAEETRRILDTAQLPNGVKFYNFWHIKRHTI